MNQTVLAALPTAIGAILAASIAAILSWGNLVNAKEQKVSEFRQQWINALRQSISEYIAALTYISILYRHNSAKDLTAQKDSFEMALTIQEAYARVHESYNDIKLRINPNEANRDGKKLNDEFLEALENSRTLHNSNDFRGIQAACDVVRDAAIPLLKYEWTRVRGGEPAYKVAKRISLAVVGFALLSIVAGLVVLFQSNPATP